MVSSVAKVTTVKDASGEMMFGVLEGKWQRNKYVGVSLVGKTSAIMGFGKVGSKVARRTKGLDMHVIAYDPYAPANRELAIGVELVFNDETFSKMKKGVRVINVARGGVIDEDARRRCLSVAHVEANGKPWYGLLMLLRKYPQHFVINTRSKGRVIVEEFLLI
ncbi:D-3-phosphoglycerate dehydrogenase 1, chloroplastic [Olea europaea subsp. europaea]|uniref:D-3-phosphoglycerate dehydrogenase 1, chloroplastic n=1 Tax=Olea europaea subsp. europaea TaxID=158383 RepID=A0A8S0PVX9_OLEEU|nr:D-3-phosphoglycerate dehydrogenase 1, chloroplastic [Olea europaea subsp. europaea]